MKNKVVFAAAGNGKTYRICQEARAAVTQSQKRILLISYTNEGQNALWKEYKKQNQGVLDNRIVIKSWYSFLLSDWIKPYQCLLQLTDRTGVLFPIPPNYVRGIDYSLECHDSGKKNIYNKNQYLYYFKGRNVIVDKASDLAYRCNQISGGMVIKRLESIYSHIFIDEIQDYAGWDLDIIRELFTSQLPIYCVGDPRQVTYRTNNSSKNKQYRDENIQHFFEMLANQNHLCEIETAPFTRRFNQEICDFNNWIYPKFDAVRSEINEDEENCGVYLIDKTGIEMYCKAYHPVILRYDKRTKLPFLHECNVYNWGAVKGRTFERVVMVANRPVEEFLKKRKLLEEKTRAKFYVGCTRARHSVAIFMPNCNEVPKFRAVTLKLGNQTIRAFKFNATDAAEYQQSNIFE